VERCDDKIQLFKDLVREIERPVAPDFYLIGTKKA
jgi:hypothetical protein